VIVLVFVTAQERVCSPISSTATPISAAAEEQHDYDDDQQQLHVH
jgi:hypothetical protein